MDKKLNGVTVAILATDGFEESELVEPKKALEDAGARTEVIGLHPGSIRAWSGQNWAGTVMVDKTIDQVRPEEYDALLLPGGVMNPDKLRLQPQAVQFVKDMFERNKPVGAICHGPWMLVEADVIEGRRMTSWPSLKTDIRNAGADWTDEQVVVDEGLVTSRKPDDIPFFNEKLIEEIAEGVHAGRRAELL
jgi:protease I